MCRSFAVGQISVAQPSQCCLGSVRGWEMCVCVQVVHVCVRLSLAGSDTMSVVNENGMMFRSQGG